jgi:carbamoyl-phosphate synthase large subunit
MVNCNPETVSTDYDTSDRLYFEPLTFEDVLNIVDLEKPDGVIVQYGGQTPLKLAKALGRAGVPIIGTSPDAIDRAEDRERFARCSWRSSGSQAPGGIATRIDEALEVADEIGYPVWCGPPTCSAAGRWRSSTTTKPWPLHGATRFAVDIDGSARF